jgi:NAD(P)-dependent dehydrogenase (short-subunit alcohol dehydrogenase family)
MWCPKGRTKDGFETHLGVNHFGHFYLTNLLLPKLIYSSPSRIIVLTSKDHLNGKINFEDLNSSKNYDKQAAYDQSKLANVLFAYELSKRLVDKNVTVNCVDPGYVYTDLMRYSSVHKSPYSPLAWIFTVFLKTPKMGAQSVIFASVSDSLQQVTGKYIR